eukprot:TRINITY_DN4116_c0_g1_i1.p1 TRINITY_DN4116_c0_g1~~TRINITY_DN4116_c0_g1_i1.p1  ORF type:complete len:759 (-),score=234.51 TRINITY_DN4116_c0_g1_i1:185-2461(-)
MFVHRCRFVDFQPKGITCISYNTSGTLLALSRQDGNVEIWSTEGKWSQVHSMKTSGARDLVWLNDEGKDRLFGSSLSAKVYEIDLNTLQVKNESDSYGGAVWSMAINEEGKLAIGCDDGCVRIFSTADNSLEYQKTFAVTEDHVLSVTWNDEGDMVYAGSQGHIYALDGETGHNAGKMLVEKFSDRDIETKVWCLLYLGNKLLVSGDSLGRVSLWKVDTFTQVKNYTCHGADVLRLSKETEEDFYATGVDSKVEKFHIRYNGAGAITVDHRHIHRLHTHDVHAMDFCNGHLVSGGSDTMLCCHIQGAGDSSVQKKYFPLPLQQAVSVNKQRQLLARLGPILELWKLSDFEKELTPEETITLSEKKSRKRKRSIGSDDEFSEEETPEKKTSEEDEEVEVPRTKLNPLADLNSTLAEKFQRRTRMVKINDKPSLSLRLKEYKGTDICESDLSHDGKFLAYSTSEELKVMRLNSLDGSVIQPKLVTVPMSLDNGYKLIRFCPHSSSHLLALGADGILRHLRIKEHENNEERISLMHEFKFEIKSPIVKIAIASDEQWLALCLADNNVIVFNLETGKLHVTLPQFEVRWTAMTFLPESSALVLASAAGELLCFDVESTSIEPLVYDTTTMEGKRRLAGIPALRCCSNPVVDFVVDESRPNFLVAVSSTEIFFLSFDFETKKKLIAMKEAEDKKEVKKDGEETEKAEEKAPEAFVVSFSSTKRYQPLLHVGCVGDNEIMALEMPWTRVVAELPDTLERYRYAS